jgi:hypothetical protein
VAQVSYQVSRSGVVSSYKIYIIFTGQRAWNRLIIRIACLLAHLIFDLQLKFEEAKNTDCSENRHGTLTLARHSKGQQGGGREVHDSPGAGHRRRRLRASVRPRRWEGLGAATGRVAVYAAAFSRDGEEAGTGKMRATFLGMSIT